MGTLETRSSKTLASLSKLGKPKSAKEKTSKEATENAMEVNDGVTLENGNPDSAEAKITVVEENGGSFVPSGDLSDNEDGEVDESGNGGHEFRIGDFVWGKIRSHPWWPGQVYDPSSASDLAAKMRHKGRVLVAYFGDGTFAWCKPSQLKLFEENFEEMSKQSVMKTFSSAVQQATDEIFRALESKMACSCVSEQNRARLGQPIAENAGIKEGVLVPNGEIRKVSYTLSQPSEFLYEVKRIAEAGPVTDSLAFRVLMSRVSAFYRAKGGRESPKYHVPVSVSGLEDLGESSVKVQAQGPSEDWPVVSVDAKTTLNDDPPTLNDDPPLQSMRTSKRKQRSIADLIASEETSSEKKAQTSGTKKRKPREKIESEETGSEKKAQPLGTKKIKLTEKIATEETNLEKKAQASGKKERKPREKVATEEANLEKKAQSSGKNERQPKEKIETKETSSERNAETSGVKERKTREKKATEETSSEKKAETLGPKERKLREKKAKEETSLEKKAEILGPKERKLREKKATEETSLEKKAETSGPKERKPREKKAMEETSSEKKAEISGEKERKPREKKATEETGSEKKAQPSVTEKRKPKEKIAGDDDGTLISLTGKTRKARLSPESRDINGVKKVDSGEAKEETKGSEASKGRQTKKKEIENGSVSGNSKPGSGQIIKVNESASEAEFERSHSFRERKKSKYLSPPFTDVSTGKRKADQETELVKALSLQTNPNPEIVPNEVSTEADSAIGSSQKQDKTIDRKKADVPTDELRTEVRSTAASPLTRRGKKSMVVDFMSVYRDSVSRDGSNNKSQSGRKRKKSEEDQNPTTDKSPVAETESKRVKRKRKTQETEIPEPKTGKDEKPTEGRRKRMKKQENAATPEPKTGKDEKPATALFAAFGPASDLPTKADLITRFGKYGELDEDETDMFYNNFCARISFRNGADAELAYKDSVAENPFQRATVEFSLTPISDGKSRRGRPRKSPELVNGNRGEPDIVVVKRKLETVSTMLEETEGRVSEAMKTVMKREIRSALEMVMDMVAASSQK